MRVLKEFNDLYTKCFDLILNDTNSQEITSQIINRFLFLVLSQKIGICEIKDDFTLTTLNEIFKSITLPYTLYSGDIDDSHELSDLSINSLLTLKSFDLNFNILSEAFKKGISDTKTSGVYYTPEYICEFILKDTIISYLSNDEANTTDELLKEYNDLNLLKNKLYNIKILDPSCGIGVFLIKAIDILFEIHEAFDTSINEKLDIISQSIYGVDLDEKSVELTKLLIFLKFKSIKKDYTPKAFNIKCGNSLIDDDEISPKAFKWNLKFDIIIGNPPYINIYRISANKKELNYYKNNYASAYKKFDLYLLFIEKGLELLKENGKLGYIIPSNFTNQPYGYKLREILLKNTKIRKIVDLTNYAIFKRVSVDLIILIFDKNNLFNDNVIDLIFPINSPLNINTENNIISKINQNIYSDLNDYSIRFHLNNDNLKIIKKIQEKSIFIDDICHVAVGTRSIPQSEFHLKEKLDNNSKKLIVGKDILKNYINYDGLWIDYKPNKLGNPMFPELFENEKIIIRDILSDRKFLIAYDDKGFYTSHTATCCLLKSHLPHKFNTDEIHLSKKFDLKYVYGFLISKVVEFYFKVLISSGIHVYVNDIRQLPIVQIDKKSQKKFINLVDDILKLNEEFYSELNSFYNYLNHDKLSRKLKKYYELNLKSFKKELSKIKIDYTPSLVREFKKSVSNVKKITDMINEKENQLNQAIYELYSFSSDEIEIIESFVGNLN